MHIDQKRITTVNLLDGRAHDFILHKESWGYKLCSVSKDEVLNILLSPHDFCKLRQEIAEAEGTDIKRLERSMLEKRENVPAPTGTCIFQWSTGDWLSFN
jgi:hypothetical protein